MYDPSIGSHMIDTSVGDEAAWDASETQRTNSRPAHDLFIKISTCMSCGPYFAKFTV